MVYFHYIGFRNVYPSVLATIPEMTFKIIEGDLKSHF